MNGIPPVRTCQWITNEPGYSCEADYCGATVTEPGSSWCLTHYCKVFRRGFTEERESNDGQAD
jgi:hypothetical protein